MTDSHTSPEPGLAASLTEDYRRRLEDRIAGLCQAREAEAAELSADAAVMVALIGRLSSGGKRVRALLAYHSFVFAGGDPADPRILDLGAAIEFFQTAALIHDDILDRSDTRRGQPSVHRAFEALHAESGWGLDREHFGVSAAILTGDLALALADECFSAVETEPGTRLRRQFNRMKWEVMAGQYLDIVEEVAAPVVSRTEAASRAATVLRYKSAKYTFEHPTVLGGLLAGADERTADLLAKFALPIGEAFQVADDDLGVFGDPDVTGKPAGDDLLEGKRTALIAFALEEASAAQAEALESVLGHREATASMIERARGILEETGARQRALEMAHRLADEGLSFADELQATLGEAESGRRREALEALKQLALKAVSRSR